MANKDKISILKRILAWIGLIIITIILCVLAYALLTGNSKLILPMIFALAFISILFWVGIKLAKDAEYYNEAMHKKEREKEMYDISHQSTKNI